MADSLLNLDLLIDFVELLVWTGQLSDERPTSAIIIGTAGGGKTSVIEALESDWSVYLTDFTARDLSPIMKGSNKVTHVLLADMLSIFGHKSQTVKLSMRLISQMTGETISHDPFTGERVAPRQLGLITAIPPADYRKNKKQIEEGGFGTRFLKIRYSYSEKTIAKIHQHIERNGYAPMLIKKKVIKKRDERGKLRIKIPFPLARKIRLFMDLIETSDDLRFRIHRHLRALVKASARRRGRMTASQSDFEIIKKYYEFLNAEGKEI